MADRHLDGDGCFNAGGLGGLPAAGGLATRRGTLVRADTLDRLSAAGRRALEAHGARTVIDLRNEVDVEACLRAGGLTDADVAALRARALEPAAG